MQHMPEIAEVETTRRAVNQVLPLTVHTVQLSAHGHPSVAALQGVKVGPLDRVGKWMSTPTSAGVFVVHLGMSGAVLLDAAPKKHTHVHLTGVDADGREHTLGYDDPRRFGRCEVLPEGIPAQLGPDLWDTNLTGTYLYERAKGRKLAVKPFLLDQRNVAGVGSYLVDEGCFRAKVDPVRAAGSLSPTEWQAVLEAVIAVSQESLAAGGATFRDFRRPDGEEGAGAERFAVYGRAGLACPRCSKVLHGSVVGGRSVVKCERCQV